MEIMERILAILPRKPRAVVLQKVDGDLPGVLYGQAVDSALRCVASKGEIGLVVPGRLWDGVLRGLTAKFGSDVVSAFSYDNPNARTIEREQTMMFADDGETAPAPKAKAKKAREPKPGGEPGQDPFGDSPMLF